jgi:hypothetical protein
MIREVLKDCGCREWWLDGGKGELHHAAECREHFPAAHAARQEAPVTSTLPADPELERKAAVEIPYRLLPEVMPERSFERVQSRYTMLKDLVSKGMVSLKLDASDGNLFHLVSRDEPKTNWDAYHNGQVETKVTNMRGVK